MISTKRFISTTILLGCFAAALPAADEPLPPAEKILDRYIEVTGGKAAYAKLKSQITSMTMFMPAQNMKISITQYVLEPDKRYAAVEMPGMGTAEEGSNGTIAWSKNPAMGPRLKEGEERDIALRSNALDKDLNWKNYYTKAETVGTEDVDGKTCYKVSMTPKVGPVETRYYDKATGYIAKLSMTAKTPMGDVPSDITFKEFKATGGITSPTKMTTQMMGQQMDMTIDSVQYNPEISPDKFKVPDDIQALVDKKSGAAAKPAAVPAPAEKK